jgi:Flp pilus assembly protein TadG
MRGFNQRTRSRRGVIIFLTAFLIIVFLGMIAFAVDLGYILTAKTQLQSAADSAALAAAATMGNIEDESVRKAKEFGGLNKVGTENVIINDSDVVYGLWDTNTKKFTASTAGYGNAVQVTAHADSSTSGAVPLFFGGLFGRPSVNLAASAVATTNPRDICFIVDLSSSMNDDTDPSKTSSINDKYTGAGTAMMQKLFDDLDFGTYPGSSYSAGSPILPTTIHEITVSEGTVSNLYKKHDVEETKKVWNGKKYVNTTVTTTYYDGPLFYVNAKDKTSYNGTTYTIPSGYLIYTTNDGSGQTPTPENQWAAKAYSWIIDEQLGGKSGIIADKIGVMANAKPNLDSTDGSYYTYWKAFINAYPGSLSYLNYVRKIEPVGRTDKPFSSSNLLSPISIDSPYCVYHDEETDAGLREFPAGEMPTHAARRAIVSAIKVIKDRNEIINDLSQQDRVSIVTFTTADDIHVVHNLNTDYEGAIDDAAKKLQACGYGYNCTASGDGLLKAIQVFQTQGRPHTNKVVVFLTDGAPNIPTNPLPPSDLDKPNANYTGDNSQKSALYQVSVMQGKNWIFFPLEIGLQGNEAFMQQMLNIGKGVTTYHSTDKYVYSAAGDPAKYEPILKKIFNEIITAPKIRLVQ